MTKLYHVYSDPWEAIEVLVWYLRRESEINVIVHPMGDYHESAKYYFKWFGTHA